MTVIVGFSGSHRVGKSTLQRELCSLLGAHSVQMPTYKVVKDKVKTDVSLEERISIQYEVLSAYEETLAEAAAGGHKLVITDRTPIDIIAYLIADVTRTAGYQNDEVLLQYIRRSTALTLRYFNAAIIVPPGIPLVEDSTSAPCSRAYIEHLHALCCYYTMEAERHYVSYCYLGAEEEARKFRYFELPKIVSLGTRVNLCSRYIETTIQQLAYEDDKHDAL